MEKLNKYKYSQEVPRPKNSLRFSIYKRDILFYL